MALHRRLGIVLLIYLGEQFHPQYIITSFTQNVLRFLQTWLLESGLSFSCTRKVSSTYSFLIWKYFQRCDLVKFEENVISALQMVELKFWGIKWLIIRCCMADWKVTFSSSGSESRVPSVIPFHITFTSIISFCS